MPQERVPVRVWAWTAMVAIAALALPPCLAVRPHLYVPAAGEPVALAAIQGLAGAVSSLGRWDWLAFGLLAVCAAFANRFSTKSAAGGASIRFTNVFVIAGAVVLPLALLAALPVVALAPDLWTRRHRPRARVLVGWVFNVAQAVLAAQIAGLIVQYFGGMGAVDVRAVAVLLLAAGVFTLTQAVLVGVVIALDRGIPLLRADTFESSSLLRNGLIAVLGVLVGALWLTNPALLILVPLLLLMAYRLSRDAGLSALAEVDGKTGLHNWRYFERMAQSELAYSRRIKRPVALLFVDLDHFKQVNDRFGHAAGDEVLQQMAALLARTVRKGDLLARFGGEEFVILLPGTDTKESMYLAERLRSAVADHVFTLQDGRTLQCTTSVGVAGCPEHGTDFAQLMEQADAAMYLAKQTRNAVARAGTLPAVARLQPAVTIRKAAAADAPAPAPGEHPSEAGSLAGSPRTRAAPVVLAANVAAGLVAIGWSLLATARHDGWLVLLPFLLAAAGAEFVKVRVYEADQDQKVRFTFTIAVTMAAVVLAPYTSPLVSLLAAAVQVGLVLRQRRLDKVLFNLTNLPMAAGAASGVYLLVEPSAPVTEPFTLWHLFGASMAVLTYHVVNLGSLLLMISLHTGQPLAKLARESAWYSPTKFYLGFIGAYLAGAYALLGLASALLFAVPLLILRYSLVLYARKSEQTIVTLRAAKAEIEKAHEETEQLLRDLIEILSSVIDARDQSVAGHSRRVAKYAVAVGWELGLKPSDLALLHTAGLLHDLGKVGVPEAILHKPAGLTLEEYDVVKKHAGRGEGILTDVPQLAAVARIVGEHHERFDGAGYPRALSGQDISMGGRILAVADALETMLADRPYARPRDFDDAMDELGRCAGTQFDPAVVAALVRAVQMLGPEFFTEREGQIESNWAALRGTKAGPVDDDGARSSTPQPAVGRAGAAA